MSHHLRHDHICQNCGYIVNHRFCGNCGQENIETRQSFGHLFRHFFEDITHYEGKFWQTMKYLFTRPGFLTKEFLAGKRNSYVAPVKLYIFISFLTFLLPYLLPDFTKKNPTAITIADSSAQTSAVNKNFLITRNNGKMQLHIPNVYTSERQMDSTEALLPEKERLSGADRYLYRKYIRMQKYTPEELADKYLASFSKNFPKALFVYMPLFALIIWLFHGKKRWFYFDHAILTLHYFSFILLCFCLYMLIHVAVAYFASWQVEYNFRGLTVFLLLPLAFIIYFYLAHKRFFGERKIISFLKSSAILLINLLLFIVFMGGLGFVTLMMLS